MIGQVVGPYRVEALTWEGGMGSVYVATHTLIGSQAAIKSARSTPSASSEDPMPTALFAVELAAP